MTVFIIASMFVLVTQQINVIQWDQIVTDASTTFTASSPNATVLRTSALGSSPPNISVDPSLRQAELAKAQLLQASLADRRSPTKLVVLGQRAFAQPSLQQLTQQEASLPNELGSASGGIQSNLRGGATSSYKEAMTGNDPNPFIMTNVSVDTDGNTIVKTIDSNGFVDLAENTHSRHQKSSSTNATKVTSPGSS